MDFKNIKAITIPEGNVIQISTAAGLLWKANTSRIPAEYQEVEYIYMPASAYINTGWIPSEGATFTIKFSSPITACYICGCGSNPRLAVSFGQSKTEIYNTSNGIGGIYAYNGLSTNKVYEVETYSTNTLDSYVKVDGEITKNNAAQNTNFDKSLPMLIGAWSYSSTSLRTGEQYIYYSRASVNGIDAFELIPCYRKEDDVVGMYDTVNNVFLTNAGSGEFEKPHELISGNLADINSSDWLDGYRTSSSGIIETSGYCVSNYIGNGECLANATIYFKGIVMSNQRLQFYDLNKNPCYLAYPSLWADKVGFDNELDEGYINISVINESLYNAYYVRLCGLTGYYNPIITINEPIN